MEPLKIMLDGYWERRVGVERIDAVRVPGTYKPVGECVLSTQFGVPAGVVNGEARWFLCADGVLSSARFSINGNAVGEAGPYAPYRFEIRPEWLADSNEICAHVRDLPDAFGPTPGRK